MYIHACLHCLPGKIVFNLQMASKISNLAGTKELVRGMINGISQQMQILEDFIDECKQQVPNFWNDSIIDYDD